MQVDHINENTIRVRIDKNELASRGLKVLDLLGDRDKIQHFFYSILDEVDTDHSFSQDAPVTFQVMPNNGGLDLLISKVTNKDRDNLTQMFGGEAEDEEETEDSRKTFIDLDSDEELDESDDPEAEEETVSSSQDDSQPQVKKPFWKFQKKQAYSFKDLDPLTELADNLRASDLSSSLYFERGEFFLELTFNNENYAEIKPADAWAIANEYGIKVKISEMARVRTTGKCLIACDALGQLRKYFDKNNR
ncbi:adaptor protein MecA [Lactobacillus sp. ESL0680]|uniref:adaptor protein MecA n=1 Tax=Lactobacillus sp. ESL0680 TaxID=2983210 RepID=UPI0023FA2896|nr:adaptor protein MecA [Lactobacillus sp. ESL0680]WEV39105.1 adaptor protein MecA [Lactobacillus sp. ESL0680]